MVTKPRADELLDSLENELANPTLKGTQWIGMIRGILVKIEADPKVKKNRLNERQLDRLVNLFDRSKDVALRACIADVIGRQGNGEMRPALEERIRKERSSYVQMRLEKAIRNLMKMQLSAVADGKSATQAFGPPPKAFPARGVRPRKALNLNRPIGTQ